MFCGVRFTAKVATVLNLDNSVRTPTARRENVARCRKAVGLLDHDSAGTGTEIRPDTVRTYAAEAGFRRVDLLPIEHDFWRFYRLMP